MRGLTITTVTPTSHDTKRGDTFELFKGLSGRQVTLHTRARGAIFGNHFHTGLDPSKDPECFFLITGEAEITAHNRELQQQITTKLFPGQLVVIEKNIFHTFTALTDLILIEYRSTIFDPANPDCFSWHEYQALSVNKK